MGLNLVLAGGAVPSCTTASLEHTNHFQKAYNCKITILYPSILLLRGAQNLGPLVPIFKNRL